MFGLLAADSGPWLDIVCMMSREVNTVITGGKAVAGPGMGDP